MHIADLLSEITFYFSKNELIFLQGVQLVTVSSIQAPKACLI